jgi:serine/threonine-protein phosphatase PGAM5
MPSLVKLHHVLYGMPVSDDLSIFKKSQNQCLKRQLFQPKLPYPAWDYNWDGRMTEESTLEASRQQVLVGGKTRHVILVRHGQYDETSKEDALRKLTPLGRLQAERTGARLARMAQGANSFDDSEFNGPCVIQALRSSSMTRARETAEIIAKHLRMRLEAPDPLLNEALPSPMIPIRPDIEGAVEEVDANHDRIEEGFQKYIYRGEQGKEEADEFEIIVCHGNVIRYMFCRALQLPPEAWLRMSIFNCSITYLLIRPDGHVSARMLGDIGHLDYAESTFSSKHGFKW